LKKYVASDSKFYRNLCNSGVSLTVAVLAVAILFVGAKNVSAQNLIPDGTYYITNQANGLMLDVSGNSTANGGVIDQWGMNGGDNQKWQLTNLGSNYVKLINVHSGLALDVSGGSTANNAAIIQWSYNGGNNQRWQVVSTGSYPYNQAYELVSQNSGLALDDPGWSGSQGTNLDQYAANGGANQLWGFASATANASIAAAPVDTSATSATKALYSYLRSTFQTKIIGGTGDGSSADYVYNLTGQYPLIRMFEMGPYSPEYAWYWSNGGDTFAPLSNYPDVPNAANWYLNNNCQPIISFQWHWYSPMGGTVGTDTFYTSNTTFDVSRAVTPGTAEYTATLRDIDAIAVQLKRLSDANVPVLWRPLHEAGGTWFWWSAKGGAAYIALWNLMYNRLVNTDGIHNLIWVWNGDDPTWYPGNSKVDVLAIDANTSSQTEYNKILSISGGQKFLAMSETGQLPDVDSCFTGGTPWAYVDQWGSITGNTDSQIKSFFTNPNTATLQKTGLPAQTGPVPLAPGTYKIINRLSGLALEASGGGTTNGTIVDQWSYGGGWGQQWTVTSLGSGQYQIMNYNATNMSLDAAGGGGSGTWTDLWSYSGGSNQKWIITPAGGSYYSYYKISPSYNTNLALDDYGGSTSNYNSSTNAGRIDVYTWNGSANQEWYFQGP
jgi:mannan endo-1,4-beta-mannosidase